MFEQLAEKVRFARIALEKDKDVSRVLERISGLESEIQESEKRLQACYENFSVREKELEERLNAKIASLMAENDRLSASYNKVRSVVAEMEGRVKGLEDKYDPLG